MGQIKNKQRLLIIKWTVLLREVCALYQAPSLYFSKKVIWCAYFWWSGKGVGGLLLETALNFTNGSVYILEGFCFANIICVLPRDKKTAPTKNVSYDRTLNLYHSIQCSLLVCFVSKSLLKIVVYMQQWIWQPVCKGSQKTSKYNVPVVKALQ